MHEVLPLSLCARRSSGNSLGSSSRKAATQAGSSPTTGVPASISWLQHVQHLPPEPLGAVEHAPGVERPAAAQERRGTCTS